MYKHLFTKNTQSANGNKFQTKWLITFAFLTILCFSIAVPAAPGDLDPSFGTGGIVVTSTGTGRQDETNGVAVQADGKVVVVGTTVLLSAGTSDALLIRYNTDGTLDNTFGSGGMVITDFSGLSRRDLTRAVIIQSDGKIVIAGSVEKSSGSNSFDFAIVRYNLDGTLDSTFGGSGKVILPIGSGSSVATSIAIQQDGKIIAAGQSPTMGNANYALVRYNPNGTLDGTFGVARLLRKAFSFINQARAHA